jgi:hypothetical protein
MNRFAADALYLGHLPELIPGLQDAKVAGLAAAARIKGSPIQDHPTLDLLGNGSLKVL